MAVKFDTVLVRYGEIAVKSREVRARMERELVRNVREMLLLEGLSGYRIRRTWGRIFVEGVEDPSPYVKVLVRAFGVTSVSPCARLAPDPAEIERAVLEVAGEVLEPGDTFEVRVRRADKRFPLTSKELERRLGAEILARIPDLKVDLERPSKSIRVEVREEGSYLYYEEYEGPGGLPYGVEGKVVSLVSGGIDSAVASWMMMKRGCEVVPIHYDMSPFYGEDAKERALEVLRWLRLWVPRRRWEVYVIPLGEAHARIKVEVRYRCLLCKLLMYKVAERIAEEEGAKALVTGESLGQVASQTLDNLYFLSTKVRIPVLRPLVGYDKEEIADLARKLGLASIALRKVLACTLSPKAQGRRAVTHAGEEASEVLESSVRSSSYGGLERVVEELLSRSSRMAL